MDVAIAGAGMGGLASAILLARDGHRVVVHDRMLRPAPVGSGFVLQPTGLAVLRELGLEEVVDRRGARIHRMLGLVRPSGRTVLDVGYPAGMHGLAVQRRALFDALHAAASDAGVRFETSFAVSHAEIGPRRRLVSDRGVRSVPFDLIVDAMGAGSPMRPDRGRPLRYGALWATVPWSDALPFDASTLEQRYLRASRMIGVLPVGSAADGHPDMATFFWSVRDGEDPLADRARWIDEVESVWPECADLARNAEPIRARYRHHTHTRPVEPGLVRIGDAWHATSPQLGQGANMALIDALSLATALRVHLDPSDALAEHVACRRVHVAFYQALSVVLTPFYQSDSRILPVLRDHVVAPLLRRRGVVHAMIAAMVGGGVLDPVGRIGRMVRDADPQRTLARTSVIA